MATQKGQRGGQPLERLVDARADGLDAPQEVLRARAALLIESAEPFQVPTGRKQRVLMRLGQGQLRRRASWLRPALVAGFLVSGGAIASAALTHWPAWVIRSVGERVTAARPESPAAVIPARRVSMAVVTEEPRERPSVAEPSPQRPPAAVSVDRRPRRAIVPEDPSLMVAATRALRHDHDPRRARALAARYMAAYPTGALAEEALALSIDAAVQEHDPDAATLSSRYLKLYPRGSFRGDAARGLSVDPAARRR